VYGYVGGDPVNHSDTNGTCADPTQNSSGEEVAAFQNCKWLDAKAGAEGSIADGSFAAGINTGIWLTADANHNLIGGLTILRDQAIASERANRAAVWAKYIDKITHPTSGGGYFGISELRQGKITSGPIEIARGFVSGGPVSQPFRSGDFLSTNGKVTITTLGLNFVGAQIGSVGIAVPFGAVSIQINAVFGQPVNTSAPDQMFKFDVPVYFGRYHDYTFDVGARSILNLSVIGVINTPQDTLVIISIPN
jgi:hypothetical protein